jgi:hypothetical protein
MHVFYKGASLYNQERWHKFNCRGVNEGLQSKRGRWKAFSEVMQILTPQLSWKTAALLLQESINLVLSQFVANKIMCNHFLG